jgi:hypothetical protein
MATNILHQVPGFVPSRGSLLSSKSELDLSFPFSSAMNLKGQPLKTCEPLIATVISGRWCIASSSITRESQLLQVAHLLHHEESISFVTQMLVPLFQ